MNAATPATQPSLSVVLVSYRSYADLARCLPSLEHEHVQQIIVVDNAAAEKPTEAEELRWLCAAYPAVEIVSAPANDGYAGGNNLGLQVATGTHVLFLNPDTELQPGALGALLGASQKQPDALITAKLLLPEGTINACGLEMHCTGVTSCRGLGQAAATYRGLQPTPLLSGAAFIAPTRILRELDGFADYFMYLEDAELSLRAKLMGYKIFCAAEAQITHHYAFGLSPQKFYYLERNRLLTLLRVYEMRTLRRLTPALLLTELLTWTFALLKGPRYLAARAQGYRWLWQQRLRWRAERHAIQARRQVADAELLADSTTELPLEQLTNPARARLLRALLRPLYACALGTYPAAMVASVR